MLNNMNREQLKSLIQNSELKLANLKAIEYDGLKEKITELESVFKEFKEEVKICFLKAMCYKLVL